MKKNKLDYFEGNFPDERDYCQFLRFAEIGILCLKKKGEIECINRFAYDLFSLQDQGIDFHSCVGKNIIDIVGEFVVLLKFAETDEHISGMELHITTSKKNDHWLYINCRHVVFKGENLLEIVFHDITSLKKVQKAFQESQQKLDSIIETTPDVIYQLDDEGNFTFVSNAIREYGYDPDELIGKNIMDIVHPDDREKARFRVNERRTGDRKTNSFELRLLTRSSESRMVEVKDRPLEQFLFISVNAGGFYFDDLQESRSFRGTLGIARDISRRIIAERIRDEVEKKYQFTLQSLHEGYYELSVDGKIVFVNDSFGSIIGKTLDDIRGVSFADCIIPEDREKFASILSKVKETGESVKFESVTFMASSGRKRIVNGSIGTVLYSEGVIERFGGIVYDITDKVKIEKDLLQARKLEAVGILAGGIAHDYNNALTAIIGNISLAKMIAGESGGDLADILKDAETGAYRIKDLTSRLSTFSKGGRPNRQKTEMRSFIADVVPPIMASFTGSFTLNLDDEIWPSEIDAIQMGYVFEHILDNAKIAAGQQGIISVTAGNRIVEQSASHHEISLQKGNYVVIIFSDNGCGIDEENLYNIFDPYYTTRDMASGMGLAISYAIVKRHRGYIDVTSRKGEGATFYVYLPAHLD